VARFTVREDRGDGLDLRGIRHGADEVSSHDAGEATEVPEVDSPLDEDA